MQMLPRKLTRLPHRLSHAFFLEIVYTFAFSGKVDLRQSLVRAWDEEPSEPKVCVPGIPQSLGNIATATGW